MAGSAMARSHLPDALCVYTHATALLAGGLTLRVWWGLRTRSLSGVKECLLVVVSLACVLPEGLCCFLERLVEGQAVHPVAAPVVHHRRSPARRELQRA